MPVPFPRRYVPALAAWCAVGTLAGSAGLAGLSEANAATPKGLFLTVSGSRNTWIRGVRLNCDDVAHSVHPQATAACADLAKADGDFDLLPGTPSPQCSGTADDPVTATAAGTFRGHPVDWRQTYPNACALDADTGPVFRF